MIIVNKIGHRIYVTGRLSGLKPSLSTEMEQWGRTVSADNEDVSPNAVYSVLRLAHTIHITMPVQLNKPDFAYRRFYP